MNCKQVIAECGCVSGAMLFTLKQLQQTNYTVCGNQTDDDGQFPSSPTRYYGTMLLPVILSLYSCSL